MVIMRRIQDIVKSHSLMLMKAMFALGVTLMVACGEDPITGGGEGEGESPTPSTPTPTPPPSEQVSEVVNWMDKRLKKEYYWMDEYNKEHSKFDLSLEWNEFLDKTLMSLTTNMDDGSKNASGQRTRLYTYVDRWETTKSDATRASLPKVSGYGIELSSYVVRVAGITEEYGDEDYGFVVEHAYPGSAAAEAGIRRGDVILKIDGKKITESTFGDLWMNTLSATSGSMTLSLRMFNDEAEEYEFKDVEITASRYEHNPVAYSGVLSVDKEYYDIGDKKIGYLSYLSFDSDFNEALVSAFKELSSQGVTDMILDLRANGGGHVDASVMLASMLLDESYVGEDKIYARLKHNPKNEVYEDQDITLRKKYVPAGSTSETDLPNLSIQKLWVICSEWSASASEMVIVGLRGLDVEVTLVGNKTEGKNCGMEVTTEIFDGFEYEFAPITFMNENGKGFSDYGDGIIPETHLAEKANDKSLKENLREMCSYYPIPLTVWGDTESDIALVETVKQICGSTLFKASSAQAFSPRQMTTRSGGSAMPQRSALKVEREDLASRGLIVREGDFEYTK